MEETSFENVVETVISLKSTMNSALGLLGTMDITEVLRLLIA